MNHKYYKKNKLPQKLLACAISISVLTLASSEVLADDLEVSNELVETKTQTLENQEQNDVLVENENKVSENENLDSKDNKKEDQPVVESKKEDLLEEGSTNVIKEDNNLQKDKIEENSLNKEDKAVENKAVTNDATDENEEVIEWKKTSSKGNDSKEVVKDGIRYNRIESTKENDNGANPATYKKDNVETDPQGNTNFNLDFIDETEKGKSRFGVFLYHKDNNNNIFVGYDRAGWFWEYKLNGKGEWLNGARVATPNQGEKNSLSISLKSDGQLNATNNGDKVFDTKNIPSDVLKALLENRAIVLKAGTFGDETTKVLIKTNNQENIPKEEVELDKGKEADDSKADYDTIKSNEMSATIDKLFPRVKEYYYNGKVFKANTNFTDTFKINDVEVKPVVSYEKISKNEAKYILKVKDKKNYIDAELDVRMKILKNQLHFDIANIKNNNNINGNDKITNPKLLLSTIDFRDNFLASVSSSEKEAKFDGARMSTNTHHAGDVHLDVTNPMPNVKDTGFMYGFVSNDKLSAGIWSNSQFNYGGGSNDYTRITANKKTYGQENFLGLASSPYIYQKAHKNEDGTYTVFAERTWINPSSKVVLAEDLNDDGKIDWQDGAIAYRDIMNNPKGYEYVKDLVGQRIAMNFGSQAQNPFLTTLDGVKKVYLNTDGLGQMVLLKGYGSEGHDSGHLNYADIGKRIGGSEDFNKLLELGKKYGARMGIHVNASETYPESKYFTPDRLKKDANGKFAYGWNWIDQGINIDASYDLANGRFNRFEDLKKIVGDNLDFIYVDVWGNGQSGDNSAWATHILAKELNDLGWRAAFEWGFAGEYDSTFQHWAADLTYGGYSLKGINSNIARFIRNDQKDSWVGNFERYGGAAVNPLLGGYDMIDFEGWQGRNDWSGFIRNIFKTNLPTKFIQHYKVYNWKNGEAVSMTDNNESYKWTPEMEIKLRNQKESGYDELVISRKSNDVNSAGYKQRTMKLNDKVVFDEGKYLIPWEDEGFEKLYHFNPEGGETTWEVLDGWSGKVYVYELTDLGKANEKLAEIVNGKIKLDAKANTAYVIYKQKAEKEDINWSEGMGIEDVGFNSKSLVHWEIKGDKDKASVVLSQGANPMLRIEDNEKEVSLSQKIKGLKANTKYAIYVGVDNRSDARAYLDIRTNGKTYSNYTEKSIALNYVKANAHNTWEKSATVDNKSYFQNMYVFFTTGDKPEDTTVTLRRLAGSGASYFDDLRVFENNSKMYENSHDLKEGDLFQDFEDVPQGIFPFVIGGIEGVEDNRTHLAERHDPYTQKGWNGKVISDVIEGNWSLKTNGLTGRNRLVYQTIPQNFRFEEGKKYQVAFDYEAGSDGTYAFVIGQGEYTNPKDLKVYALSKTWQEERSAGGHRASFLVEGGEYVWIGILSTTKEADKKGVSGNEANFRSYKDFMLDNLLIKQVIPTAQLLKENFINNFKPSAKLDQYQEESVKAYQDALTKVIVADESKLDAETMQKLIDDVYDSYAKLEAVETSLGKSQIEKVEGISNSDDESIEKAFDNDPSTIWHSPWGYKTVGESVTIDLKEEIAIKNFIYLPRQSGSNGTIKAGKIEIIDAEGNSEIFEFHNFENDAKAKLLDFGKILKAKKIIITPTHTYGDTQDKFMSAAEFIFSLADIKEGHKAIDYDLLAEKLEQVEGKDFSLLKENFEYLRQKDGISKDSYENILEAIEEKIKKDEKEKELEETKEKIIKELKEAGITSDIYLDQIRKAKTKEGVEALKKELLESHKKSEEEEKAKQKAKELEQAKEQAIKELKEAGITSDIYLDQIRKAKTKEGVEALKKELLESHKKSEEEEKAKQKAKELEQAKEQAIKELKEAGITSDIYLDQIRKAKTKEGVEALKKELLESHKKSEEEEKAKQKAKELEQAKEQAIKELKEKGVKDENLLDQIKNAKTIEEVEAIKKSILESLETGKSDPKDPQDPQNPDGNNDSGKDDKDKDKNKDDDKQNDNKNKQRKSKTIKTQYEKKKENTSSNVKTGVEGVGTSLVALLGSAFALFKTKKRK